jgi:filamentous hemagglutinin
VVQVVADQIFAEAPDGTLRVIEVKAGNADLSIRQSEIFPQIRDGSSIPREKVAESFGLRPGVPLKKQGYPNGIPAEIMNFRLSNGYAFRSG